MSILDLCFIQRYCSPRAAGTSGSQDASGVAMKYSATQRNARTPEPKRTIGEAPNIAREQASRWLWIDLSRIASRPFWCGRSAQRISCTMPDNTIRLQLQLACKWPSNLSRNGYLQLYMHAYETLDQALRFQTDVISLPFSLPFETLAGVSWYTRLDHKMSHGDRKRER